MLDLYIIHLHFFFFFKDRCSLHWLPSIGSLLLLGNTNPPRKIKATILSSYLNWHTSRVRTGLSPEEIIKQLGCLGLYPKSPVPLICTPAMVHDGPQRSWEKRARAREKFQCTLKCQVFVFPQPAHLTSSLVKTYPPYSFLNVPWHSSAALPQTSRSPAQEHCFPKASLCVSWSLLDSET